MGFSPLEGLMMATRSGSLDPGLLLHLQEHCGLGVDELRETLTHRSGLLGVSGISADVRQVLQAADAGSDRARLAYERFVLSVRRAIGSMVAVLGGIDALVFTGGIGENNARVRRDAATALEYVGLGLRDDADTARDGDRDLATANSSVRVLVVRAREDLVILKEVLRLAELGDKPAGREANETPED
jgi:acetate kinase